MADYYEGDHSDLCPYENPDATVLYRNTDFQDSECLHCRIDRILDDIFLQELKIQLKPNNE